MLAVLVLLMDSCAMSVVPRLTEGALACEGLGKSGGSQDKGYQRDCKCDSRHCSKGKHRPRVDRVFTRALTIN